MKLTIEEQEILEGKQGETWQKLLLSIVKYGEMFGATELADISGDGHFVMSMGVSLFGPFYEMLDKIIAEGIKTKFPFTLDPRPIDNTNIKSNFLQKIVANVVYKSQDRLEAQYQQLGLRSTQDYSCTCYLPEMNNIPKRDAILAWSESSAVVYVNSILGAKTHRNAGGIDILMNIIGKTPVFGLLTDEGRKATWKIEIKCQSLPNAQILGSAIGLKVMEEVPYISGLDSLLGTEFNEENLAYLKDMGAAAASNGAVGLYHIENMTPEAKEMGDKLLLSDYQTYIIDEQELERIYQSYPNIWKNPQAIPKKCFIGCPHLSFGQLIQWTDKLVSILEGQKVQFETILLSSPKVIEKFKQESKQYNRLLSTGAKLSYICPLMFMSNPLWNEKPIITNSNKLRTYTSCRFFPDEEILQIIKTGSVEGF